MTTIIPRARTLPKKVWNVKRVSSVIADIASVGKEQEDRIHMCAIHVLLLIQQNMGAVNLLTDLFNALSGTARPKAFRAWCIYHAPVAYSKKKECFVSQRSKNKRAFLLDEAFATPYWEFIEEADPIPVTLLRLLKAIQKRVQDSRELGEDDQAIISGIINRSTLSEAIVARS